MYKAIDVAKYIVSKCIKEDHLISNLYLQNILYCIQKVYIKQGKAIFFDDIEVWRFGPCVPDVYYHFCCYGAKKICLYPKITVEIAEEDKNTIDPVVEKLRDLYPWDEEFEEIRKENSAWNRAIQKAQGLVYSIKKPKISISDIADYG